MTKKTELVEPEVIDRKENVEPEQQIVKASGTELDPNAPALEQASPMLMMLERVVSDPDFPIDRIEYMFGRRDKEEERIAKQAFYSAMSQFRKKVPVLPKDKQVKFQNGDGSWTEYWHTSLGKMMEIANPILGECGLDADWDNVQADGKITCTATVTHLLGHSKSTSLTGSPETSGKKNPLQQVESAITYLKKSTMGSLLGLASEIDDDGRGAADGGGSTLPEDYETITDEQRAQLQDMIEANDVDKAAFLRVCKVSFISEIHARAFEGAKQRINESIQRHKDDNS